MNRLTIFLLVVALSYSISKANPTTVVTTSSQITIRDTLKNGLFLFSKFWEMGAIARAHEKQNYQSPEIQTLQANALYFATVAENLQSYHHPWHDKVLNLNLKNPSDVTCICLGPPVVIYFCDKLIRGCLDGCLGAISYTFKRIMKR